MTRKIPLLTAVAALAGAMAVTSEAGTSSAPKKLDGSAITPEEIDATVTRLMKAAEVQGTGIAVINAGRIAFVKGYGFRDKEKRLPLTEDTVMSGASFTKAAFAYMVMRLVDANVLDLDKPVDQYLPKHLSKYPAYADLAGDARSRLITARMLLSHTSGFPNWRSLSSDRRLTIAFQPGSKYAYSGEGIDLLQMVVEAVTKKPLNELMREQVFRPLGLTRSSLVWEPEFEGNHANGYDVYGRSLGPERWKRADAAGSLLTTLRDFARFVQAVLRGTGLRKVALAEMLKPQIRIRSKHQFPTMESEETDANDPIALAYGLGWGLYRSPYGQAFFKEGHSEGWRNYAVALEGPMSGMIIMTNSSNGEGIFKELLETALADRFTPIEWEGFTPYDQLPARPPLQVHKRIRLSTRALDRYVGRYGTPPTLILTVRREGDHLTIQENDEPRQDLFPETATRFFSSAADDVFVFESDGSGRVKRMVLLAGGQALPAERIEETARP